MDTLRRFISIITPKAPRWKEISNHIAFHFSLLFITLLPLVLLSYHFMQKEKFLQEGHTRLETLIRGAKKTAMLRKKQAGQIRQYAQADPLYVEKQIESYTPLQVQIDTLSSLIANEALQGCFYWQNRLAALIGDKNLIKFHPEEKKVVKNIQEVVLKLMMPVEVGNADVRRLLSKIEGVKIGSYLPPAGRPDLLVKKITLKRKPVGNESQVFELDMELIKREGV
jgi:hypothetical protein